MISHTPWPVDRWGRLLSGASMLGLTALTLLVHPAWAWGGLLVAANLVFTSVTDRCPLHDLLIRLGAREREDIYLPGGRLRLFPSKPPCGGGIDLRTTHATCTHEQAAI